MSAAPVAEPRPRVGALADERLVDVLLVGAARAAGEPPQMLGFLASQVHSIVRLDPLDSRLREDAERGQELAYEGDWIPVRHLRTALGLGDPPGPDVPMDLRPLRVLIMQTAALAPAGLAPYCGLIVDEVVEIVGYPLRTIRPFPVWAVKGPGAGIIWGAVPDTGGSLLLLLDGSALVSRAAEP